jgi:uncharacterized protein
MPSLWHGRRPIVAAPSGRRPGQDGPVSIYAVRYTYDDRIEHRMAVRPAHRAWLARQLDAGTLLASGPLTDGEPGALLVFRADTRDELEALLAQDPFATEGVVAATEAREWEQVLGPWADAG